MYKYTYRHGTMTRSWSMRYEAKHHCFKRWTTIMGNYKNIPKTLAMHHQRYLCYQLADTTNSSFLTKQTSIGPGKTLLTSIN